MILEVEHRLSYKYSDNVNLNPHYFYLSPQPSPHQRILSNELEVLPKADKLIKNIDQEGNIQHICFMNIPLKEFEVKTSFKIESADFNFFDFIFFPFETASLPIRYPGKLAEYIPAFFQINKVDFRVKEIADSLAKAVKYSTIDFLTAVTSYISENFRYVSREKGDARQAEETLTLGEGSCRDFSVLMMAMCLTQGLVARFVSGYLFGNDRHMHDLHAWVDVFLPGGGWRGFDPTEGQVVNKNYISLASSFVPNGINPVRGSFRGAAGVNSCLDTKVSIVEVL